MINNQDDQVQQQIAQLEMIVKQRLTKEAVSRLSNIRVAHPERYVQALVTLGQMLPASEEMISDDKLKEVLIQLTPAKKEFNIRKI